MEEHDNPTDDYPSYKHRGIVFKYRMVIDTHLCILQLRKGYTVFWILFFRGDIPKNGVVLSHDADDVRQIDGNCSQFQIFGTVGPCKNSQKHYILFGVLVFSVLSFTLSLIRGRNHRTKIP